MELASKHVVDIHLETTPGKVQRILKVNSTPRNKSKNPASNTAAASHTKRQSVDLKMPSVLTAGNEVTKPKPAVISRQGGATREPSPAGGKLNNLVNEMARIAKGKKNSQRI